MAEPDKPTAYTPNILWLDGSDAEMAVAIREAQQTFGQYRDALGQSLQVVEDCGVKGFVWRLSEGRRVSAGWYFDYEAERLPINPSRPGSGFGFAPGFLVADDGAVRVVGWGELRAVHGLPPVQ